AEANSTQNGNFLFELPAGSSTIQTVAGIPGSDSSASIPLQGGLAADPQGDIFGYSAYDRSSGPYQSQYGVIFELTPGGGGGGGGGGAGAVTPTVARLGLKSSVVA